MKTKPNTKPLDQDSVETKDRQRRETTEAGMDCRCVSVLNLAGQNVIRKNGCRKHP